MATTKHKRTPTSQEIDFLEESLAVIKSQMKSIIDYTHNNPWSEKESEKLIGEFNLQAEMTDRLAKWTSTFIEISGINDMVKRLSVPKDKAMAGFTKSGITALLQQTESKNEEEHNE